MYKRAKEQVHFIGIGGIGMSGIAEVLARQGFPVSGSDLSESDTIKRLRDLGIRVEIGHRAENLSGAKVVVYSSAVTRDNPEMIEARKRGLPVVPRAEMLAELMRLKFGIAVAGTHGKTTTTSLLATILAHAGADPTVIVGGKVDALGGNAKLGTGNFLVAEADESDGSFLKLSPVLTIITNIDNDHLDYYSGMAALREAFLEFANKVPYYGRSIVCADDAEIAKILPKITRPTRTYGFSPSADLRIENYAPDGMYARFDVARGGSKVCEVCLSVPGEHNARNAVAALAAALELDVPLEKALEGLARFTGVRRRFEAKGTFNGATIIDDYGHHPAEIEVTLATARRYWTGRLVVAFQPHRYTRTKECWDQFGPALKTADHVMLLDIYPAGETPIAGIDAKTLAAQNGFEYAGTLESAEAALRKKLRAGDLLVTLGAGSVTQLASKLKGATH